MNPVEIINPNDLPMEYIYSEIEDLEKKARRKVVKIEIEDRGDGTCLQRVWFSKVPFTRLRRITGYLSNVDNWNAAKLAELKDRVKHNTGGENE